MARRLSASSVSLRSARARSRSRAGAAGAPTSRRAPGDRRECPPPRHGGRRRSARRAGRLAHRSHGSARRRCGAGGVVRRRPARDGVPAARGRSPRTGVQAMSDAAVAGGAAMTAEAIAADVRSRRRSARDVAAAALERIAQRDRGLNCFTLVRRDDAVSEAAKLDARIAGGEDPGPLAGVPFAAKNLFDVAGVTTVAGAKIEAERAPATRDATAVAALRRAGALLVGLTNMDEYAHGLSTQNTHHGPTPHPHDPTAIARGASGGSAAAVASGVVPLSLRTGTNRSSRVPSAPLRV